ncbi:urate hydroxylase PuuD [Sandarakinorhabdus sp.]|uniref:urate hydroxylase PuuD n=1 Tax=Sandarakinorhabdus sp. TaxID=1916663 RepID=UPI00286D7D70|nr:urate hydroxylase PuuD [Sandarakinorhabdus sp.]
MANTLGNLSKALLLGLAALLLVIVGFHGGVIGTDLYAFGNALLRVVHTWAGVLWIGLLYYFNFVQIPTMPQVPAELKPGVTKYIAPKALLYFRHSALLTVVIGLAIAGHNGYLAQALVFGEGFRVIGLGMWLGLIMAFNVWFLIWPNQKIALGIVDGDADAKAKAGKTAMIFSRTNFILSFPMLYCMIVQGNGLAA